MSSLGLRISGLKLQEWDVLSIVSPAICMSSPGPGRWRSSPQTMDSLVLTLAVSTWTIRIAVHVWQVSEHLQDSLEFAGEYLHGTPCNYAHRIPEQAKHAVSVPLGAVDVADGPMSSASPFKVSATYYCIVTGTAYNWCGG